MNQPTVYCPFCSMSCLIVGKGKQPTTGIDITVIHCNKCNRMINLLGVSL